MVHVDASVHCMQWYSTVHQTKTIDIDEWIWLSVKTQSLLYGNSLGWVFRPKDLQGPCDPRDIE